MFHQLTLKLKQMKNLNQIRNIIAGYENQLANAEINKEDAKVKWLKEQINEGHKLIAQFGTYN